MRSLGLSILVCTAALYLAGLLFGLYDLYIPLAAILLTAIAVVWLRARGLRSGLPSPYGRGKVSKTDAKRAIRQGLLIILGAALSTLVLLGSVYLLPAAAFFAVVFGLMGGLPLNEIVFFVLVARYERVSGSRIFMVSEEREESGESAVVKTYEMRPRRSALHVQ